MAFQVSKPFYNLLMPYFFPERGAEDPAPSTSGEHVDSLDPGIADLAGSSEDLVMEASETRSKKRNRHGGKFISRLDPKSWSGRLRGRNQQSQQTFQQQPQQSSSRFKTVAEDSPAEEFPSDVNPVVEP